MRFDNQHAVQQCDVALEKYVAFKAKYADSTVMAKHVSDEYKAEHTEVTFYLMSTIRRIAPPNSIYEGLTSRSEDELAGLIRALRTEYDRGYVQSFREMIHGETFSSFLDMASHLAEEGYAVAAAVIAGGVLEQHLVSLCVKHGVNPVPESLSKLNEALYKNPPRVIDQQTMKQITAWAGIRNDAAHGNYDKVEAKKVELMLLGIRHFVTANPA